MKEIKVSKDDGIIVQNPNIDPRELKKVRLINFIEPFIVYGLALIIIWVSQLDEDLWWMWVTLGILVLWMLIISPWVHYEKLNEKNIFLRPEQQNFWFWFFECRGMGSVKKYYQRDENGKPGFLKYKDSILKIVLIMDLLILCVPYAFEKEYDEIMVDLFGNASTLTRLGGSIILLIAADIGLVFFMFPLMLRLDNLKESFSLLVWLAVVGIPFVIILNQFFQIFYEDLLFLEGAQGMKGDPPYDRLDQFNLLDFGGQMTGYVFWGWAQQLLFLSIFSTNFCRSFDLEKKPKAPYIAAGFSAFFFGLIHLPNFWLSIITWGAGFFWSLHFMENRNLFIFGMSHGLLGTLGNKLLPISYNVGPNSV
jgi:hypothetical protein